MTGNQRDPRIEALGHQGKSVACTKDEYQGSLRAMIQQRAAEWLDQHQDIRAQMALSEVQRLDKLHGLEAPTMTEAQATVEFTIREGLAKVGGVTVTADNANVITQSIMESLFAPSVISAMAQYLKERQESSS